MQTWVWIVIAVVLVAIVAAALIGAQQQQKRRSLQDTFGPEYEREINERRNWREAERELSGRLERRRELDIRPLEPQQRERFTAAWSNVQAHFVDAPADAVQEADTLITSLMRERGYPMGEFDQRAADLSVEHGKVIDRYRTAHDISQRSASGQASTEDLRQAMVDYRALFSDLLGADERTQARAR